jgi:hypothetical protein
MKYSIDDLKVIRSIDSIRSNPGAFLPFGTVNGLSVAWGVLLEIMNGGCGGVQFDRFDDWWLLAANRDWLATANESEMQRRFDEIVPYPEKGDNTCHPEVVIGAFACAIVVLTHSAELRVKGVNQLPQEVRRIFESSRQWQCLLAYRLERPF